MDEDQIYRGAFRRSLVGAVGATALTTLIITVIGSVAPHFLIWHIPRIAVGYATMFIVLWAMHTMGGGLTGPIITGIAWVLSFVAVMVGTVLGLAAWADQASELQSADEESMALLMLAILSVTQRLGISIAGYIHGD